MNCYAIAYEYFVLYGAIVGLLTGVFICDGIHRMKNEKRKALAATDRGAKK